MRDSTPIVVDSSLADDTASETKSKWNATSLLRRAERSHSRLPGIRKIPLPAIAIILFVAFVNVVVWVAAAIVLVRRLLTFDLIP